MTYPSNRDDVPVSIPSNPAVNRPTGRFIRGTTATPHREVCMPSLEGTWQLAHDAGVRWVERFVAQKTRVPDVIDVAQQRGRDPQELLTILQDEVGFTFESTEQTEAALDGYISGISWSISIRQAGFR